MRSQSASRWMAWVLPYLDTSWRHTCVKTEQVVQHTAYIAQITQEQRSKSEKIKETVAVAHIFMKQNL